MFTAWIVVAGQNFLSVLMEPEKHTKIQKRKQSKHGIEENEHSSRDCYAEFDVAKFRPLFFAPQNFVYVEDIGQWEKSLQLTLTERFLKTITQTSESLSEKL